MPALAKGFTHGDSRKQMAACATTGNEDFQGLGHRCEVWKTVPFRLNAGIQAPDRFFLTNLKYPAMLKTPPPRKFFDPALPWA
jgi:hypothetical protein